MRLTSSSSNWHDLADRVLAGQAITREEGQAILASPDEQLLDVLSAAYRVRHHWFGNKVHLNFLINAKSGLCGEDCGYCSQSKISQADIPRYNLLNADAILEGARMAAQQKAGNYCIVTAGRGPTARDVDRLASLVTQVKEKYALKICVSAGLLTDELAQRLKDGGVDRINHNLNTSARYYPKICTTHTYQDRLNTLQSARKAGLEICCGGIVGMGETDADVVDLALQVGRVRAEAVPINFLIPIEGTPLQETRQLNPRYCLKVLSLFRLANPATELRIAAGREVHLGPLQPLAMYAADSLFVGDYLTTKGQPASEDHRMIEALGFEPVLEGTAVPVTAE